LFRIGQLGDSIVALPAMWAVRKHFPDADITLLSDRHAGKAYVTAEDLFQKSGLINNFILYKANIEGTRVANLITLLPILWRSRFDLLVYLSPRIRTKSQIWRDLLFFRIAGIKKVIGHHGIEPLPPIKGGIALPCLEHEADHLLTRLSKGGISVPKAGTGCMDLNISTEEKRKAKKFINDQTNTDNLEFVVCFGPGSNWPSKIWPKERYAEVGRYLIDHFRVSPLIIGGPEDKVVGDWLIEKWGKGVNAAGLLTIRDAAAVLADSHLYIGNDTGTMHLAAAVRTPCVAIIAAQDYPGRWYPYGNKNIVLRKTVPCEGCMMRKCPNGSIDCLMEISVDDVLSACRSLLFEDKYKLQGRNL